MVTNNIKRKYRLLSLTTAMSLCLTSIPMKPIKGETVKDVQNEDIMASIVSVANIERGADILTVKELNSFTVKSVKNYESSLIVTEKVSSEDVVTTTLTNIPTTTTSTTCTTTSSTTETSTTTIPETTTTITSTTNTPTTTKPTTTSTISTTTTTTTTTITKPVETYVVYKPSTHYIHTNTCRWCDETCQKIDTTEGLEVRKCSECKPNMEIVTEYKAPVTKITTASSYGLSDYDITLLRKIVSSEYGADWVPVQEKAKIVASVMAMVKSPKWPNTISGVLAVACEPWGFNRYRNYYISDSTRAAVNYYFANQNTIFAGWCYTSWWGDGQYNHFYC